MNTYIITYKQFPRERRGAHVLEVKADTRKEALKKFRRALELVKEVQHLTPFIVDHISIVSIFRKKVG